MIGVEKSLLSTRNARWLAWFLVGLTALMMGIGLALQVTTRAPFLGIPFLIQFSEVFALCGFAVIGGLIVARQPRHPIGWIWILIAISFGRDHFVWGYAYYGYIAHPGSLPGVEAMIVLLYWLGRGSLGMLGLTLLLLLFPSGRPLSPRWAAVAWIVLGATVISFPVSMLAPDPIGYFPFPTTLIAAGSTPGMESGQVGMILTLVGLLCVVAAAISLVIRLVRSSGIERQQLKWFVTATALLPFALVFIYVGGSLQEQGANLVMVLGAFLGVTASLGLAVASAIAIFRYRLWDIDIIIRRTLVYGALTVLLVAIYLGSVVLLEQAFRALTGQDSPVAIVISTLIIAALFNPARMRIQESVDRRFYRNKYDAQQTLAGFAASARDEVELEQLAGQLLNVVRESMQPERVSLWLGSKIDHFSLLVGDQPSSYQDSKSTPDKTGPGAS